MKRLHLLLLLFVLTALSVSAQELNIQQALDGRFRTASYATETVVEGSDLDRFKLQLYHSVTVTDPDAIGFLSGLVNADAARAVRKEESIRQGHINYGFYEFQPVKDPLKRFVFFFSNKSKAVLIYMEGAVSFDHIKSLIKK